MALCKGQIMSRVGGVMRLTTRLIDNDSLADLETLSNSNPGLFSTVPYLGPPPTVCCTYPKQLPFHQQSHSLSYRAGRLYRNVHILLVVHEGQDDRRIWSKLARHEAGTPDLRRRDPGNHVGTGTWTAAARLRRKIPCYHSRTIDPMSHSGFYRNDLVPQAKRHQSCRQLQSTQLYSVPTPSTVDRDGLAPSVWRAEINTSHVGGWAFPAECSWWYRR